MTRQIQPSRLCFERATLVSFRSGHRPEVHCCRSRAPITDRLRRLTARSRQFEEAGNEKHSTLADLNGLWRWCALNGVPGVGTEKCKVSLFESDSGNRGIYSVFEIKPGEEVIAFPLRLALVDYKDDQQSVDLFYPDAPWSIRLACKLLREKARGEASPWFPYIQSLPREIPCVLTAFSYDDIAAIEYEDIREAVDHYVWLVVDAWQRLKPEAHGNSTREEFDWALSVVHSRAFGAGGKRGPSDVHMLVPLIDMINHGGNVCQGLFSDVIRKTDKVEWQIVPSPGSTSQWDMRFVASMDLQANEEVIVSYGERNNDDFFLFYGFVPSMNPNDDYVLFVSLHEAIEWYCAKFLTEICKESKEAMILEAVAAAERDEGVVIGYGNEEMLTEAERQRAKIRLQAGGFLDGSAVVAFESLGKMKGISVGTAVAWRCHELLLNKTHLLDDLQFLKKHLTESEHRFSFLYQFYDDAISKYRTKGNALPLRPAEGQLQQQMPSFSQILTKTYVVYKKMILWDAVLGLYRI